MTGIVRLPRPRVPAAIACVFAVGLVACGGGSGGSFQSAAPSPLPTASACTAIGAVAVTGPAIVNGNTCSPSSASIALLKEQDASGKSLGDCSGTVIAPRAVLTAGHCVTSEVSHVQVTFGDGVLYEAQSSAPSPSYAADHNGSPVDIGVVITSQDLPRRAIPLLVSRAARVGETAVVAGWGIDQNKNGGTLRAGETTITAINDFIETTYNATAGVCQGDSGGALLVNEGGTWALAGVISGASTAQCNSGQGFYAIVNAPDALSFILQQVPGASRR